MVFDLNNIHHISSISYQYKFWKDVKMLIPDMTNKNVEELLHPESEQMCSGKEANYLMKEYFINTGTELQARTQG